MDGARDMQTGVTELPDGAFTVDVEDYFQVSAFASTIRREDWDGFDCRVERNTRRLLEVAAETGTQGTFFVLGWVAERCPQLVRDIHNAGHEIGCHSQWHELVYELGASRFRADLREARDRIEQLIGNRVRAYRAPSFSITKDSLWALEILAEEGFDTDSSIYPIRHDRYGLPGAPLMPHRVETRAGTIREFPGMVCELGRAAFPVGGGGYLRLLPWQVTVRMLRRIRRRGRPLNVYVHPWEVDPDQPRLRGSLRSRFRHYQNLRTTLPKLRGLLSQFRLTTMSQVLQAAELPTVRLSALPSPARTVVEPAAGALS